MIWCPKAKTHGANCASMSKTGFYPRAETYEAAFRLKTGCCPRAETYEAIVAFMLKTGCTLVARTITGSIKVTKKKMTALLRKFK